MLCYDNFWFQTQNWVKNFSSIYPITLGSIHHFRFLEVIAAFKYFWTVFKRGFRGEAKHHEKRIKNYSAKNFLKSAAFNPITLSSIHHFKFLEVITQVLLKHFLKIWFRVIHWSAIVLILEPLCFWRQVLIILFQISPEPLKIHKQTISHLKILICGYFNLKKQVCSLLGAVTQPLL